MPMTPSFLGSTSNSYTTPTYTAPSPAAQSGGMDWNDYLDIFKLGYGVYQDNRSPRYSNPPLTPEQKQVHELYLKMMMNPALANNAANVNAQGNAIREQYKGLSWTSPKTFSGDVGYGGSAPAPSYPPAPSGPMPRPTDPDRPTPGDNPGHYGPVTPSDYGASSPYGALADPNALNNIPTIPNGIDPSQLGRIGAEYNRLVRENPNIVKLGLAGISALISPTLGLPLTIIAAALQYLGNHFGNQPPTAGIGEYTTNFGTLNQNQPGVSTSSWDPATGQWVSDKPREDWSGIDPRYGLTGVPGGSTFAYQPPGYQQPTGGTNGRGANARMGRRR